MRTKAQWDKRLSRKSPCKACVHYFEHFDWEGGYLEDFGCSKREGIVNLWSFPFIKPQKCFTEYEHWEKSNDLRK